MRGDDAGDPIFDRAYLLALLTEVRPDCSLADFRHYANFPDDARLATLLADAEHDGEVAIYADEFNEAVVCLTPLGAGRAGVRLSASHPPIWLAPGDADPPIIAAREAGFVLFTDLDYEDDSGNVVSFLARQVDETQLEPAVVLTHVEEFAERLLLDRRLEKGRLIPGRDEFALMGLGGPWPLERPFRAGPDTPSGSTWQEQFTRCPFCRRREPTDPPCPACHGRAPGRPCPACAGRALTFKDLCVWCQRAGADPYLAAAATVEAQRRPHAPRKPSGEKKKGKPRHRPRPRKG